MSYTGSDARCNSKKHEVFYIERIDQYSVYFKEYTIAIENYSLKEKLLKCWNYPTFNYNPILKIKIEQMPNNFIDFFNNLMIMQ